MMTQTSLKTILNRLKSRSSTHAIGQLTCDLCGQRNWPSAIISDPVYGSLQKRLVQFTCTSCGFYQEDVV